MKNLINAFIFMLSILTAVGQTQPNLPSGATAYSSSIFKESNNMLWTGKVGSYTAMANKSYVDVLNANMKRYTDSIIAALQPIYQEVRPNQLNANAATVGAGNYAIAVARPNLENGNKFERAVVSYTNNVLASVPIRQGGRIQISNGILQNDAANKRQIDSLGEIVRNNGTITNQGFQTVLFGSFGSTIESSATNAAIISSANSRIHAHPDSITQRTAIIASVNSNIGASRTQSAIIASSNANLETFTASGLKWNSAIIASEGGRVQSSNSYTLVTGRGTTSNGSAQLVIGRYNPVEPSVSVNDPLKKTFIVANGQGADESVITPSVAFYVTHGGRAWVQNQLEVNNSGTTGGIVLRSPDGSRWRISISNTGTLTTTKL